MTGVGAEIYFGGPREVYLCEFERGTRTLFQCGSNEQGEDQKKGLLFKNFHKYKKVFSSKISTNSSCRPKVLAIFHEFLSEDKKKRSSSQKLYKILCGCTKITKIRAENTNLGVLCLDLHFNSPEPVNFFGAVLAWKGTIFVWGGTNSHLAEHGHGMPPSWRRACQSQQKISQCHDLAQDFLNLRINQFYKKWINFITESFFFFERERIHFDPSLLRLILYFSRVLIWFR